MRQPLIDHSEDLKRLAEDGYEVETWSGFLILKNIPYVTTDRSVERGTLVSKLELAGDVTARPGDHVAYLIGGTPCDHTGQPLTQIIIDQNPTRLADGLEANCTFSSKPSAGYRDYYEKMNTYASIISSHARVLDPDATPRTFSLVESADEDSVFNYVDTASSRAQLGSVNEKLKLSAVAIIGLGGTGSYILDLVAKTPVKEVHLFDGDQLGQHNAFRSPGSASVEVLKKSPQKSEHFRSIYSQMRRGITAYGHVDERTIDVLGEMDFVFISIDQGHSRKLIVEKLEASGVPFVDVGMGVFENDNSLFGQIRTTLSAEGCRDGARSRLPLMDNAAANEYGRNIQIVELNALNAALAVIQWKQYLGYYVDLEREHTSVYQLDGNHIVNVRGN
ncbi:MAG: ThiF family adenylyltransferase [Chloroflexi bacterium]|nr:ThiF family adenylyltransferase [Chloroflexota bacterium]